MNIATAVKEWSAFFKKAYAAIAVFLLAYAAFFFFAERYVYALVITFFGSSYIIILSTKYCFDLIDRIHHLEDLLKRNGIDQPEEE